MASPDVTEERTASSSLSKLKTHFAGFKRHWDMVAVLLLVAASMPVGLLSPRTLPSVEMPNIDDSWFLDSGYKAVHGVWLGKSVMFTYGPVWQWLSSAPIRWTGYSMGKAYATWTTLPMWLAFLLCALTVQLLLPEQPPWKRFVLVIFLVIFWASPGWAAPDVRPFAGIFLFALFLRGWYAVRQRHLGPVVFGVGAAVLCAAGFFVAADAGIYALAGLLITLAGVALEKEDRSRFLRSAGLAVAAWLASSLVLVLVVNAAWRRLFDFTFWKASLAIVSSYRWNEPYPMAKADKVHVIATLGACAIIFAFRRVIARAGKVDLTGRTGFLAAAFAYGVLGLQTGVVRSDTFHVQIGIFPMVVFIGAVLFGFASDTGLSTALVLVAVTFCWFLIEPNPLYYSLTIKDRYSKIIHPTVTCPAGWSEFDHLCVTAQYARAFQDAKTFIQQRTAASDSIVVFPWNNIFGTITQRTVAAGIMLSYVASGSYLSDVDIRGLAQAAPPAGLYFSEGWGWPVDHVPNFTRNSALWFWVQSHYRADQLLPSGILGLRADYSRVQRVHLQVRTLQLPLQRYPVLRRKSTIDLGSPVWPLDSGDFLRLRLNLHYPFWWKLRKPSHLELEILRADGSSKRIPFVLPPNDSTDVWFYPWDGDLLGFFASDEAEWHRGPRPAITGLRLHLTPYDWVSVIPSAVSVEAADAVRLTLQH